MAFWGLIGLVLGAALTAPGALAGAPERLVVNVNTGLAISGFDPVAYFSDGGPKTGRADVELNHGGAVWRFANDGNRAAFAAHPEVYTPQFGGYDPVAISRGASVPGHPLYWTLAGERLYLFYSEQARKDFVADPGRFIEIATHKWPEVSRSIGR